MAALGFSGCGAPQDRASGPTTAATAAAGAARPSTALPPPEALTGALDRLADPSSPGADKLALIQDGAAPDAPTLDRFVAALRDGGYVPATFAAADVAWSETIPDEVMATVTVTKPGSDHGRDHDGFVFPLAFRTGPTGWQLTRATAEMLLAFPPGR